jgi:hypothetical protein
MPKIALAVAMRRLDGSTMEVHLSDEQIDVGLNSLTPAELQFISGLSHYMTGWADYIDKRGQLDDSPLAALKRTMSN